jgi:uncharacterized protein (UPF0371 family)
VGKLRMGGKHTTIIGSFANCLVTALEKVAHQKKLKVVYSPGLIKPISAKTNTVKFQVINPDLAKVVVTSREGINHLTISVNGCTIQHLANLVSLEMGIEINIRDE